MIKTVLTGLSYLLKLADSVARMVENQRLRDAGASAQELKHARKLTKSTEQAKKAVDDARVATDAAKRERLRQWAKASDE